MASFVLKQTDLLAVNTSDKENIGTIFADADGKMYKYVKNACATQAEPEGLVAYITTSVHTAMLQKVAIPSVGVSTANYLNLAGMPMTSLGASGSSTGEYGWIQIKGLHPKPGVVWQTATAAQQLIGASCIGSVTDAYIQKATAGATAPLAPKHVLLAVDLATTGVATTATCFVYINCL